MRNDTRTVGSIDPLQGTRIHGELRGVVCVDRYIRARDGPALVCAGVVNRQLGATGELQGAAGSGILRRVRDAVTVEVER